MSELGRKGLSPQTRALAGRTLGWAARALIVFTLAFALMAALAERFVLPAAGDAVASVVSPWIYHDADSSHYDKSHYQYSSRMVMLDLAREYLYQLTLEAMSGDYSSDPANWPDSGEIDFSAYPLISQQTQAAVRQIVDTSKERAPELGRDAIYDAAWSFTQSGGVSEHDLYVFYQEARSFTGADYSEMQLFTETSKNGMVETVVYGDGHTMVRDLNAYNAIRSWKLPVAAAVYIAGCFAILALAARRLMRYCDMILDSVTGALADRDSLIELPEELAQAQNAINAVKLENLANERAAAAAEQRKNELVAYLAHDIKTPLTSIMGYLSLLEEAPEMPLEQRVRYAGIAARKASRLEGLIDEFFEISRYNLQKIPIERSNVDVALFCSQVVEEFYPAAESRGIDIAVEAPADGQTAFVDARKLARACGNVLKNAVAYADPATVIRVCTEIVSAGGEGDSAPESASPASGSTSPASSASESARSASPAPGSAARSGRTLRIAIENRGSEISPEHLQRIFERFYREDSARAADGGGAGLGLAIAREIVQAHGGVIEATSVNGVTRFEIEIPSV